jgi:predicted ATP-dependent Lon-type protease
MGNSEDATGVFTNQYGLIVDYLAEALREMRKRTFADAINKYFRLERDLNQRDTIAVKRTVSGLLKLLYPNEEYDKEAVRRCFEYALEARRRVKEQLKKVGGMEFYDVHFSYIDLETNEERFPAASILRANEIPRADPRALQRKDPHAVVRIDRRNETAWRQLGQSRDMAG